MVPWCWYVYVCAWSYFSKARTVKHIHSGARYTHPTGDASHMSARMVPKKTSLENGSQQLVPKMVPEVLLENVNMN